MTRNRLFLLLALIAVVYASLACLRTIGDLDTGWHLATGRYHFLHHAIPAADVLSYTAPGVPFLYPPFAGALLYIIFHSFGYAGLSWFNVAAAALLACYLLWRAVPKANLATAALLVLAVPSLAYRITPRADLFSTLFFAVCLTELWRFHRGESARLWLLPIIMFLWVNLHPGFIAGLGLLGAYVLIEGLALPFDDLREDATRRIAKSWPWLAAGAAAVMVNPWGYAEIRQGLQMAGVFGNSALVSAFIGENTRAPLSWHVIVQAIDLRDPDSAFWWLLAAAVVALLYAVRQREIGAAVVLGVSMVAGVEKLRYQGLFSIVVIVIGGTLLAELFGELADRARPKDATALKWAAVALVAVLGALTALRVADLASDRAYIVSASTSSFGAGESWWFPERAAAFIEREKLPGNIFQPYNLGGFTALRLGPKYPDYIDGRLYPFAPRVLAEEKALLSQSPDSILWLQVASGRNVNVMLLPLARYGGLGGFDLNAYCGASAWRPVYMDEVSLVLMRRTEQNKPWLDRLEMNCQNAPLAPPAHMTKIEAYSFYANSGAVFYALARDGEAEAAWHHALELAPEDPNIHLFLAQLYQQQQHPAEAEREYRAALARRESGAAWYALGRLLAGEHRYAEAERAIANSIPLTATPINQYKALAQVQLLLKQPAQALESLIKAERVGPPASDASPFGCEFRAQIAEGRAEAARQMGKPGQAVELQEEALRQTPQSAGRWKKLAELATSANQPAIASEAVGRAQALEAASSANRSAAQAAHQSASQSANQAAATSANQSGSQPAVQR